jgi:hypothetical protein
MLTELLLQRHGNLAPVLAVLQSRSFISRVAALQGYEAAHTGRVLSVAQALG